MASQSKVSSKRVPNAAPATSTALVLERQCSCGAHVCAGPFVDGNAARSKNLQRHSANQHEPSEAPPIVHEVLHSPGHGLDAATRSFFEPRLGHDLSRVRVHTDSRAAESARATRALAYTVGHDVVFGESQYRPQTSEGLRLLTHELTHVAQQESASLSDHPLTIGPTDHLAEREAQNAAKSVTAGVPLQHPVKSRGQHSLQRSVAGDVGGTLIGAAGGAAAGFAIGGPVGALVGGFVGGIGGLVLGDVLSADKRGLTSQEKKEAQLVFDAGLDYGAVKIAESPIMAMGDFARTPFDTVYFPPGTSMLSFSHFMPWLIHELTHVWQYQHGVSVLKKMFWALHGASAYDYGGEPGLKKAASERRHFASFNTEQQGDILSDYYRRLKAGADTSAYEPFVEEVRGKRMGDFPVTQTETKLA